MESFLIVLNDTQSNQSSSSNQTTSSSLQYNQSDQALAVIIIAICAAALAIPLGLMGGFKFPQIGKFQEYYIQPLSKKFIFPPLVGMIIMGMVSRNFFGSTMDALPLPKAQEIKNICISFILIRAGQQINLNGQGILTVLMSFIPQQFEALTIAFIAYSLFNMPLLFCFTLSYVMSCLGPSIMVQPCMTLLSEGYGKKTGIISKVLTAGTLDVVLCLINFGIFQALAYNSAGLSTGMTTGMCIANVFFQNLTGIGFGITASLLGFLLNHINNHQLQMTIKLLYCLGFSIMIVLVGEKISFPNMKYIGSLFFGYISGRVWKDKIPINHIYWSWFILQPLFFGLVGAALIFTSIKKSVVLNGFICLMSGIVVRMVSCIFITMNFGNLSKNDAIFHTLCWIPKATVQAAIGGIVLADSTAQNNSEVQQYGQIILTVSILAIMLFGPIGAILINTLGPLLLEKEEVEQKNNPKIQGDPDSQNLNLQDQTNIEQNSKLQIDTDNQNLNLNLQRDQTNIEQN